MDSIIKRRILQILRIIGPSFRRLLFFSIFFALLILTTMLIVADAPNQYDYSEVKVDYSSPFDPAAHYQPFDAGFKFNVLLDVHSHTDRGGGQLPPETVLQWHIANGYNAVVITDHNEVWRAFDVQKIAREKYNDQIKVLIGEEWSNCRMHMGLIGITELIPIPKFPTDEEIQQVIKTVHDMGGLVIVNHIPWSYWSGLDMPSLDDLISWGVDFFDVTTDVVLDLQTLFYVRSKGVRVVAGSDIHELIPATSWTLLYVDSSNFTEQGILDALRTQNTSFIFDAIGHYPPTSVSQPPENKWFTMLYAFIQLGQFFKKYYVFENGGAYSFVDGSCGNKVLKLNYGAIFSTIFWIVIIWVLLEIFFGLYKLIMRKIMRRKAKQYYDDDTLPQETPLLNLWDK